MAESLKKLALKDTRALLKGLFGDKSKDIEKDLKNYVLKKEDYLNLLVGELGPSLASDVVNETMFIDKRGLVDEVVLKIYYNGHNYEVGMALLEDDELMELTYIRCKNNIMSVIIYEDLDIDDLIEFENGSLRLPSKVATVINKELAAANAALQ